MLAVMTYQSRRSATIVFFIGAVGDPVQAGHTSEHNTKIAR